MIGDAQQLRCSIVRARYQADTFAICQCRTQSDIPGEAVMGHSDSTGSEREFTALGNGLPTEQGKEVILSGQWEPNKKYGGLQFRVAYCEDYTGQGRDEIVAYLSSKALNGIGKKTAEMIYDKFGEGCIQVIANNPQALLEIPGIKEKKLEKLVASYQKNHALHALAQLLTPHKVTFQAVVRIAKCLGTNAAQEIRENPYILSRVHGFGFLKTDEIAMSMGVPRKSEFRIEGGILYALVSAQDDGHLFLPRGELVHKCCFSDILNKAGIAPADIVRPDDVNKVLDAMLGRKDAPVKVLVLKGEPNQVKAQRVYTAETYQYETLAAQKLATLLVPDAIPMDKNYCLGIIREVEADLDVTLDVRQEDAVLMALTEHVCIITGGPGTGKTTTLNVLVAARERLGGGSPTIALAAPTGRAARRMTEQTGREASTIHSLLNLSVKENESQGLIDENVDPIEVDMLIIDETSMVDAQLFAEVLCYFPEHGAQLVLVGDADQLPSVGPGGVLKQLLATSAIKHVKLEKIFRQGADSVIPQNSRRIKVGRKDLMYNPYFKYIACASEQEGADTIIRLFSQSKAQSRLNDIQILAPMKKKGATCTKSLNAALHDIVNPPSPDKSECTLGDTTFRVGDKVMHTRRNTDGASNGDIGIIIAIVPPTDNDRDSFSLTVEYAPDWQVTYSYTDALDYLELATAITIHKSQGSEFPVVVIPIFRSMSFFLQRSILYTAVTRAKLQVVLVGQMEAIMAAISKVDSNYRYTILSTLIQDIIMTRQACPSLL